MPALIGMLLDVSGSMETSAQVNGADREIGSWAKSIFEVIDNLVEHDVSDSSSVFAIGFGCNRQHVRVFDILSTLKGIRADSEYIERIDSERYGYGLFRYTPVQRMEYKVKKALNILEKSGAEYVSDWADIEAIISHTDERKINALLAMMKRNPEFTGKLVTDCLPPECIHGGKLYARKAKNVSDFTIFGMHLVPESIRVSTEDQTIEVIRKATNLYKDFEISPVHTLRAVMSAKSASKVLKGCIGDGELTQRRADELLRAVEPFIYGNTPFWEALNIAADTFAQAQGTRKLLFVLSDGVPSDDEQFGLIKKIHDLGVTVVSMYISNQHIPDSRKLYSKKSPEYEDLSGAAKLLFNLSSTMTTQLIPRTIFIKKGWKIDICDNEIKIFLQINHPDLIKDACSLARDVICNQDALADVIGSVSLDIRNYIELNYFDPVPEDVNEKDLEDPRFKRAQTPGTCYANAIAAVLHMATRQIVQTRVKYPDFYTLREDLINQYGNGGANTFQILQNKCGTYGLQCKEVQVLGAMEAISQNRPVVAIFELTKPEWITFKTFFIENPEGILTKKYLDIGQRKSGDNISGHAAVLCSYDSKGLRFMNSWGTDWADGGFFKVENASVLGLEFMDIFWPWDTLSSEDKEAYKEYQAEQAGMLFDKLKGLQEATYECPMCRMRSKVMLFTGTLFRVKCPSCQETFNTNETGSSLVLSLYLASLV